MLFYLSSDTIYPSPPISFSFSFRSLYIAKQQNYDSKKFSELLALLGLPMNTKMVLSKVYDDILTPKGSLQSLNSLLASNQLVDLDWSFGVTASSNECNQVGKTFLQLKLTIRKEDNELKDVFMEMTIEQFYHFLSEMEKCKSYIDLMSTSSASS